MLGNEILRAKLSVLLNYTSTNILKDATMTLMSRVIASNFIKAVRNFLTTTNMLKDTQTSSLSSVIAILHLLLPLIMIIKLLIVIFNSSCDNNDYMIIIIEQITMMMIVIMRIVGHHRFLNSKFFECGTLGYRINVHVRLFFFRSISPLYDPY